MSKEQKKKSRKEWQRERQLRQQRSQEAYRIRREIEAERKPRQWPKGKILFGVCLLALIILGYGASQYIQLPSTIGSGTPTTPTSPPTSAPNQPSPAPSTPASTRSAPSFSLKDINGTQFSLNQYSGRVIAIHFMALDCSGQTSPINDYQLQQLKTVCSRYCGKKTVGIVTVSVATCQGCDLILAQIRADYGVTWVLGNDYDDEKMDIVNAYAAYSITDGTIVLVDKKLNVAQVYTDAITADTLSSKINQFLGA